MGTAVHELFQTLGVESNHEVVAPCDGGYASPASEGTPLAQQVHVFGDVQFVELATAFREPILGRLAVGSRGGGVYSDPFHSAFPLGVRSHVSRSP
jgi:hypothetical protein